MAGWMMRDGRPFASGPLHSQSPRPRGLSQTRPAPSRWTGIDSRASRSQSLDTHAAWVEGGLWEPWDGGTAWSSPRCGLSGGGKARPGSIVISIKDWRRRTATAACARSPPQQQSAGRMRAVASATPCGEPLTRKRRAGVGPSGRYWQQQQASHPLSLSFDRRAQAKPAARQTRHEKNSWQRTEFAASPCDHHDLVVQGASGCEPMSPRDQVPLTSSLEMEMCRFDSMQHALACLPQPKASQAVCVGMTTLPPHAPPVYSSPLPLVIRAF